MKVVHWSRLSQFVVFALVAMCSLGQSMAFGVSQEEIETYETLQSMKSQNTPSQIGEEPLVPGSDESSSVKESSDFESQLQKKNEIAEGDALPDSFEMESSEDDTTMHDDDRILLSKKSALERVNHSRRGRKIATATNSTSLQTQKSDVERTDNFKQADANINPQYKIRFGIGRPNFDSIVYYEDVYNSPGNLLNLRIDYYPWSFKYPIGFGFHVGYYRDSGTAVKVKKPSGPVYSDVEKDHDQTLNLVLIPIQLNVLSQWDLFNKWLILDFWGGFESLTIQESRTPISDADDQSTYVNKGTSQGVNFGIGAGVRIDELEPRTRISLHAYGIRSILLQPYVEIFKSSKSKLGDFSRTTLGFLFSFETL